MLGGDAVPVVLRPGDGSDVIVQADKRRFARVLANLLDNADEVRRRRHRASSSLDLGDAVQIAVEDDGTGVPEDERDRHLRPLLARQRGRQPRPATAASASASSLVAEHVRLHGGRVWVEDRPDGRAAPASSSSCPSRSENVGLDRHWSEWPAGPTVTRRLLVVLVAMTAGRRRVQRPPRRERAGSSPNPPRNTAVPVTTSNVNAERTTAKVYFVRSSDKKHRRRDDERQEPGSPVDLLEALIVAGPQSADSSPRSLRPPPCRSVDSSVPHES